MASGTQVNDQAVGCELTAQFIVVAVKRALFKPCTILKLLAVYSAFRRSNETTWSCSHADIKFGTAVFPTKVEIFETYNPGAVVRILATNGHPDRMDGDIRLVKS